MIKLYHGTNTSFEKIDLSKSRPNKDFGKGFYLTDIRSQAVDMAQRRCIMEGGDPLVLTFLFDDQELNHDSLKVKIFESVSEEWAKFIISNRRTRKKHDYDIVIGPVADDGVVLQIDRYINRLIDLPTLVKELTFRKLNRQFYFGTEKAISYLKKI